MPDALTSASPLAADLYSKLKAALVALGSFREEVKKTSIHLTRNSAFLGVHPRKDHLLVTIKSDTAMKSKRVIKAEQVSANRWHLDVKIADPSEINKEFLKWACHAYELCGEKMPTRKH